MEDEEPRWATAIHLVISDNSPEFTHLCYALTHSSVIGLDAEWKPNRQSSTFPTVSLLQIACFHISTSVEYNSDDVPVFLLDLQAVHLPSVYQLLNEMFVSPNVIKLGFRFKQDFIFLSSTFCEKGCDLGFERVEPFVDITSIHDYLLPDKPGSRVPKQTQSLATICKEVLGISLSKDLQCSDWSQRPLTEDQKAYAAADAYCLVDIFNLFLAKVIREGKTLQNCSEHRTADPGFKIFETSNDCNLVRGNNFSDASNVIVSTVPRLHSCLPSMDVLKSFKLYKVGKEMDDSLLQFVRKHGDRIILKDSDRKPKTSKKKVKQSTSKKKVKKSTSRMECREKNLEIADSWQGPPPWDVSLGGDGLPKFLCDVMVEGLAKHLRCVGIDAAIPYSKKPETRDLIGQAVKEKRVLLTRDAKLLRYEYLIKNQLYRIKSLLKNEQLLEVIEVFKLRISEDQLMSRCTKCNGNFIQKPLTTEEAIEASKGFQVIPSCLFNKNLEFWQCMDCNQLYWEGTQYHNAVQKFIDVCRLNDGLQGE